MFASDFHIYTFIYNLLCGEEKTDMVGNKLAVHTLKSIFRPNCQNVYLFYINQCIRELISFLGIVRGYPFRQNDRINYSQKTHGSDLLG